MLCNRIVGFFSILLLGAVPFKPLFTRSRIGASSRSIFQLMTLVELSTYKFFQDFKGRISDSSKRQNALSLSTSQKTTNPAIATNGKSYRSVLGGTVDYKLFHIRTGKPEKTKRINGSKSYSTLASSIVINASGRDAAKRLIQYLSSNLTNNLILTAMKWEI